MQYGRPYPGQASGYLIRADIQSGWMGVSTVGDILGIIISGYLLEWVGRKHTLGIGTVLTTVGVGIQIGVQTWRGFMVGRFVNGKTPAQSGHAVVLTPACSYRVWYRLPSHARFHRRSVPS